MSELLGAIRPILLILHGFAVTLGVGGAVIADVLFVRFLKDFRFSEKEIETLKAVSQVIWGALLLLVITGVGLYLPNAAELNHSSKFLLKMIAVAVLVINGAALNFFITPRLIQISFGEPEQRLPRELRSLRRLTFALGAVSIVSWGTAFLLGSLRSVPLGFPLLFAGYIVLLSGAVVASQVVDRSFARHRTEDEIQDGKRRFLLRRR